MHTVDHASFAGTAAPRDPKASKAPALYAASLSDLRKAYPSRWCRLGHHLAGHPLLTLPALAELVRRLPEHSIEFNATLDLPLGIKPEDTPQTGLDVHQTLAQIATAGSWVLLKTVNQDPAYGSLMREVLEEIAPLVKRQTGEMLRLEAFVFISSPGACTPLHFDPDYNILFQTQGTKRFTGFPTAHPEIIGDAFFETYFGGGPRNLPWREEWAELGCAYDLAPGEALYVPILTPHHVTVYDEVSISLSLTWRSHWSFRHADAHRFNARMRRVGLQPSSPRLYPEDNRLKAYSERAMARLDRLFGRA
ncbi:MAG: transcriptional regulator [Pseudomonadota bacterium]